MAHSPTGNLLGRAAATELKDLAQLLWESEQKELERKHEERIQELERITADLCITIEGETLFFLWYDDDNNVPAVGLCSNRVKLIRRRLFRLQGDI